MGYKGGDVQKADRYIGLELRKERGRPPELNARITD